MVPFNDYYNVISIDKIPTKTEIGNVSWYYKNPLLCKLEFSATKTFLFF